MEKADDKITEFDDEEMWLGGFYNNKEDILVSLKEGMQIAV